MEIYLLQIGSRNIFIHLYIAEIQYSWERKGVYDNKHIPDLQFIL